MLLFAPGEVKGGRMGYTFAFFFFSFGENGIQMDTGVIFWLGKGGTFRSSLLAFGDAKKVKNANEMVIK